MAYCIDTLMFFRYSKQKVAIILDLLVDILKGEKSEKNSGALQIPHVSDTITMYSLHIL